MMYVYVVRNLINGKVYVGQTKNPRNRKASHFYAGRTGVERPLYRAMRKYGFENFEFEILEECENDVVNTREEHWVSHFDSNNPDKGYNLTKGGSFIGTRVTSEETKQILREMFSGEKNPMFGTLGGMHGKQHSDVSRERMSKVQKRLFDEGKNRPPDWTGRRHTDDAKRAIGDANSIAQRGKRNSQFGTAWIIHPTLGTMKVNKDELDEYLEKGWIRGRKIKILEECPNG